MCMQFIIIASYDELIYIYIIIGEVERNSNCNSKLKL